MIKLVAGVTAVNLAVLFLLTIPTGLGTPAQWLIAAGIGLGTVAVLLWYQRNRASLKERELRHLRRGIGRTQGQLFRLQLRWLGRRVRLTRDFWWDDEWNDREFTIPAGTVGQITGLNLNSERPFYVSFPGIAERVLVDPNAMEIDPLPNEQKAMPEPA